MLLAMVPSATSDIECDTVMPGEPLEILHLDDHCVAINKPPGLLVHRTSVDRSATRFAMQMLRDQLGRLVYPTHRLDKATSGVLVFGLNSESARAITEQFAARTTQKTYVALVRGFTAAEGRLDARLKDMADAKSESRLQQKEREAVTEFRTTARFELPIPDERHPTSRYSLVEIAPKTGRRHQIRRHLKHASHPIVGDTTHGDHRHNKRWRLHFGLSRMLLAATRLELAHPVSSEPMVIEAAVGSEFSTALESISSHRAALFSDP